MYCIPIFDTGGPHEVHKEFEPQRLTTVRGRRRAHAEADGGRRRAHGECQVHSRRSQRLLQYLFSRLRPARESPANGGAVRVARRSDPHARRGLRESGRTRVAEHDGFIDDYAHGRLDFAALQRFRQAVDAALGVALLARHQALFNETVLLPAIAPAAPALVQRLRRDRIHTMVVSATRAALVAPAAAYLGIDQVLGADSQPELDAPCFGAGKIRHVEHALARQGQSLATLQASWFYSDSHNDLPLLEAVDHPVVVDPDTRLAEAAHRLGWPVISLRG